MQILRPPIAKKVRKSIVTHGKTRYDDYFWLREKENPEVIEYLKKENEYTEKMMRHTESFQEKLFHEMKIREKETDSSAPLKIDDYYYYDRTEEGQQYQIYCRKKGSLESDEEILLDVNELAKELPFFHIGIFQVSPDHKKLAYSDNMDGSETFTLHVKDLETNELYEEKIENSYYSFEWMNDSRGFLYTILDDASRPYELYYHALRSDPETDKLLYHEPDERFYVWLKKSKSKEYIFIKIKSQVTTEVRYLNGSGNDFTISMVSPREQEHEYSVFHHSNCFFILTNDKAKNFRLVKAPIATPGKEYWEEIIPTRDDVMIQFIEVYKNHLVVYELDDALTTIKVIDLRTKVSHYIEIPEKVYAVEIPFIFMLNPTFDTNILRFEYSSLKTPYSTYDYNMDTKERILIKQEEVLGGYDPSNYTVERLHGRAADGKTIPISLIYKNGITLDGSNPLMLYGYGAYGFTIEPFFTSNIISLIDRGFIYAISHIRGGSARGRSWYEEGKYLKKMNTFTDYISSAEYLIENKYTSREKLVIQGASAGGLLIGAVLNMRPDLFNAAVVGVPFVDIINTMLDTSVPLTVIEYEEWGNPNIVEYFDYMLSYSPYDNVKAQPYPKILVFAGLNDPRVQYWEAAKWVAKLRDNKTDDNVLLLSTNMEAGHSGASGRYDYLKKIALEYVFACDSVGITK